MRRAQGWTLLPMPSAGSDNSVGPIGASPDAAAAGVRARLQGLTWMPSSSVARRKHRFYFGAQIAGAACAGLASVFGAYLMVFSWPPSLGQIRESPWDVAPVMLALLRLPFAPEAQPVLPLASMAVLVFVVVLHWFGLLSPHAGRIIPFSGMWSTLKAVSASTVLLYLLYAPQLAGPFAAGRHYAIIYFVYVWAIALFAAILFRSGLLSFIFFLRSRGIGYTRVAIVARTEPAELRAALDRPESEHKLVGMVSVDEGDSDDPRFGTRLTLGSVSDLAAIINRENVDEIVMTVDPGELTIEQRTSIAETCWKLGVELKMVTPFHPYFRTTARAETIGDVTLLRVEPSGLYTTRSQILKRIIDIGLSLSALLVLSPLLALVAALIKVTSPGPVVFAQDRPGLHGRVFRIYKFRTMRADADTDAHRDAQRKLIEEGAPAGYDEKGQPIYGKVANDPRVTPIGKWLRRTSIDELPQLWNVLRGEMSLVGPRPAVLADVDSFKEWHFQRHDIRPGLTGLWQVSGRSRLSFDQMVALDIKYIEEWSIRLDIKIMLKTIPALLKTDQAF